jgi:hypothetical protein
MAMRAVSVSGLKNNPAEALRQAKNDMVVVLKGDHPDALLVGLDQGDCGDPPDGSRHQRRPRHPGAVVAIVISDASPLTGLGNAS